MSSQTRCAVRLIARVVDRFPGGDCSLQRFVALSWIHVVATDTNCQLLTRRVSGRSQPSVSNKTQSGLPLLEQWLGMSAGIGTQLAWLHPLARVAAVSVRM
jgi:hypothetical protein